MAEVNIIKRQIIVVDSVVNNSYGDLTFTDKEGEERKISAKRVSYFDKIIVPGVAVQLNYAMSSFGKEYIYNAVQVKDNLPDKPPEAPKPKSSLIKEVSGSESPHSREIPLSKDAQIERAVWIKELGECIRAGIINKDTPSGYAHIVAYFTELDRVLGIKSKEVPSAKSRLVEEAMKMGKVTEEGG